MGDMKVRIESGVDDDWGDVMAGAVWDVVEALDKLEDIRPVTGPELRLKHRLRVALEEFGYDPNAANEPSSQRSSAEGSQGSA